MGKGLIILAVGALLFAQCSGDKTSTVDDSIGYIFEKQEELSFEELEYPDLLGVTMQLIKQDSLLFLNDYHGDSLIHVYNLNTRQIVRKLILAGNGPNELIPPLELQLVDDNLWILSRPLHVLTHIPCRSIAGNLVLQKDGGVPAEADCFVPLEGASMVFSGFWEKRYAYQNRTNGNEVREFGDYPDFWEEEKNIPSAAKAMFHQSRFAVNTGKHLFASCSYFALEIYEYDPKGKNLPVLKYRKQLGKYEYDFETGGRVSARMHSGADPASVDIVSGEEYLYVLTQDGENRRCRNIMVLDWEGNPVKLLKTGKRITCLAVDEKSGMGYCIVQEPEDKLMAFKL